ncbi:hypothetical protein EON64_03795 [archaeon]|nr:MAG: hypothetical protein EON64_03795 [archaeon]
MKQRLKLETAEHSLAEAKRKVTELQEKFGENQRSVAEMKGSIESLLKEQDRNAEAAQQLAALRTEHEQAVERHSLQLSNLKDEYSQLVCDKEIRLDTVTRQLQSLQSAQRSEEDAAAALENYKKRAQLSLKKVPKHTLSIFQSFLSYHFMCCIVQANATISGLQEELHKAEQDKQAINAHNSELTALVQDLQETVKSLQLECQTLTDKALELQQDQNRLQMVKTVIAYLCIRLKECLSIMRKPGLILVSLML